MGALPAAAGAWGLYRRQTPWGSAGGRRLGAPSLLSLSLSLSLLSLSVVLACCLSDAHSLTRSPTHSLRNVSHKDSHKQKLRQTSERPSHTETQKHTETHRQKHTETRRLQTHTLIAPHYTLAPKYAMGAATLPPSSSPPFSLPPSLPTLWKHTTIEILRTAL